MKKATPKQKRLISEIEELTSLFSLSHRELMESEVENKTLKLEFIKGQIVRSEVIMSYTIVDELLGSIIAKYQFGNDFPKLWRTKKFQYFNHHVLEELSIMVKLRYVKSIKDIHRGIADDISRLASLRNGLAHAFFPENLKKSKPQWKGIDIFSIEGSRRFVEDMAKIYGHLMPRTPYSLSEDGVARIS